MKKETKVGLFGLVALVVGSMLGSGLFDLPSNVANTSALGPILLALGITFIGMICLVIVFKELSLRKPSLDAGVYAYAKAGFGNYLGFNSAWGYWISAWVGNIAFMIMLTASLSVFFPIFGDGNNFPSLVFNSLLIWSITILCASGIKSASFVNLITTAAKLFGLAVLFIFVIKAFDFKLATQDMWGTSKDISIFSQLKGTMLVTLWVFIGIEGACVFSGRAKKREDIGKATIIGFTIVFGVLCLMSILPFGLMPQAQLAALDTPSSAGILEHIIGGVGRKFIALSIIISVLGALLSWTLLASEVPFVAATKDNLFPKMFSKTNKAGSPNGSLYITAIVQQLYLIFAFWSSSGYLQTLSFAASMILVPYLFSAAYSLLLAVKGETYEKRQVKTRVLNGLAFVIALLYCVWLLYAADISYLLLSSILYGVGIIVYAIARIKAHKQVFTKYEALIAAAILIMLVYSLI